MITQSDWNQCYLENKTPWRKNSVLTHFDDWLKITGIQKGSVLDLGCGTGEISHKFLQHGFDVIGIDYADAALEIARTLAPSFFYHWDLDDLSHFPFPSTQYDIIVDITVLAFIQNKRRYLSTIHKLLKGYFILGLITEHDEKPNVVVTQDALSGLIEGYFQIVHTITMQTRPGKQTKQFFLKKL